jgi:hypothetical protein
MGKGVYHVFNRGINSARILSTPGGRDFFCSLLSEQKRHFKVEYPACYGEADVTEKRPEKNAII